MFGAPLQGKRKRGKQKIRWEDVCNRGYGKCAIKNGGLKWKNDYSYPFWRTQMTEKARGGEEEE